jgi:hypothetical protein
MVRSSKNTDDMTTLWMVAEYERRVFLVFAELFSEHSTYISMFFGRRLRVLVEQNKSLFWSIQTVFYFSSIIKCITNGNIHLFIQMSIENFSVQLLLLTNCNNTVCTMY